MDTLRRAFMFAVPPKPAVGLPAEDYDAVILAARSAAVRVAVG
jgi:hypothetical protein